VNPKVNAIVTLRTDEALAEARAADAALARGEEGGPLFGLPVAHKDLVPTRGLRTTWGSPIYKDHVPEHDGLIVERIKAAGAITIGKTNTPEFGAGSQTFNEVFGRTLNPYDPSKTCGGSSGGAAVALASGLVPIADGSDLGGSLRNPASFCNVVGFRPSPGRVPTWPSELAWAPFLGRGADGAHGGGRGAAALGHGGARSALAHRHRRARRALSRPARPQLRRRAGRVEPGPRRPAHRPARDGRHRRPAADVSRRSAAPSRTASPTSRTRARSSRRGADGYSSRAMRRCSSTIATS
jgi:hypothetical protein